MNKKITLLSLGSALAALVPAADAAAMTTDQTLKSAPAQTPTPGMGEPNFFYILGEDLLGLVTTKQADGTVLAEHYSHSSHASHFSHSSHYSGR